MFFKQSDHLGCSGEQWKVSITSFFKAHPFDRILHIIWSITFGRPIHGDLFSDQLSFLAPSRPDFTMANVNACPLCHCRIMLPASQNPSHLQMKN